MQKLLSTKELESMTIDERIDYFEGLKESLMTSIEQKSKRNIAQDVVTGLYPMMRGYDYEVKGLQNIPANGNALFLSNHSNSHDVFTFQEIFKKHLGSRISSLGALDDINVATAYLFKACDGVLIDRRSKLSSMHGTLEFSSLLLSGMPGFILGEATWNLHPVKPMQKIKIGSALIGAITELPIIPVNIEYVEVPYLCTKEKDLYEKCVVNFGEPVYISRKRGLIEQTIRLQDIMEMQRRKTWKDLGIVKTSLEDIDPMIYCNHTWLKKFGAFGFEYDSESESKFLYSGSSDPAENEYRLDEDGKFIPGVIGREEKKRFVMKRK